MAMKFVFPESGILNMSCIYWAVLPHPLKTVWPVI